MFSVNLKESESSGDPSPNKLDSIKSSLKMKSANLKEGLLSYIYSPGNNPPPEPKHIDFTKRGSKLYKNTGDVFCLDDEDDDNVTELKDIEKKADTIHVTACQRVDETGLLSPCHLLVTTTHLSVLLPGSRHDILVKVEFIKTSLSELEPCFRPLLVICQVLSRSPAKRDSLR